MAGSSLFLNLARGAKVLALLLFLLPWVTVSCSPDALERAQSQLGGGEGPRLSMPNSGALGSGVQIASATGLEMALGKVSMQLPNMGSDMGSTPRPGAAARPSGPVEIGVIGGAALILLGLLAGFLLKGGAGAMAGLGSCVLAIGALCYSVFVSYPPAVRTALATQNPSGASGGSAPTTDQIAQILSVKPQSGFFILLFVLALAVLFNALAMRKPVAAAAASPVPVPPPAEPPAAV